MTKENCDKIIERGTYSFPRPSINQSSNSHPEVNFGIIRKALGVYKPAGLEWVKSEGVWYEKYRTTVTVEQVRSVLGLGGDSAVDRSRPLF